MNWTANDVAMQLGAAPQYTLLEVGENLDRMDQSLFEGFVTRDPSGFLLVGPPDSLEQPRSLFSDSMLREFTTYRHAHCNVLAKVPHGRMIWPPCGDARCDRGLYRRLGGVHVS